MARAAVAGCLCLCAVVAPSPESAHELLRVACQAVAMATDEEADPAERAKLQQYMHSEMANTGQFRRYQLRQSSLVNLREVLRTRVDHTSLQTLLACASDKQKGVLGFGLTHTQQM